MNRRPVGVIVCVIALGCICLFLILSAIGAGLGAALAPHIPIPPAANGAPPPPPGLLAGTMLFSALFYLTIAAWGGTTLVGLIRMRTWARISMIIIGGGLIIAGLLGAAGMSAAQMLSARAPMPPNTDLRALHVTFVLMTMFSLGIAGVGIWWIIYFLLRSTRDAFRTASLPESKTAPNGENDYRATASTSGPITDFTVAHPPNVYVPAERYSLPPEEMALHAQRFSRPISILMIAILLLVGSFSALLQMMSPFPLFFFSVMLSGWPAHLMMLMWCAVCGVSGIGLLKLQKSAWFLAFGLFALIIVNGLSLLLPGARDRFTAYLRLVIDRSSMGLPRPQFTPAAINILVLSGVVFALLFAGTILILLWRARRAFEVPQTSQAAL